MYILGTLLVVAAFTAALTSTISYVVLTRGHWGARVFGRGGVLLATPLTFSAAGLLVYLFVSGQYGFDYVYNYSSRDLELRYKFAAIWAGQQGSFLVWSLPGLLIAPFLIRRTREFEPYVLAPLMLVQTCLLLFVLVRNPFSPLIVEGRWVVPPDGKGLNELLHNPWMVIHPPVLFIGYGLMALPFAYAIAGLWRRDYDGWARRALPWTIAAWAVLGTALTLGGYWAYETLGWGGYWGWDPVENSSLVPWLFSTALIHGLLLQRTHGGLRRTNMAMALATYGFVFYASFMTRSGVLSNFSVHSFTEEGLGYFLVAGGSLLLAIGFWLLLRRWRDIPRSSLSERFLSRDSFFILAMLALVLIALVVNFGTSMPLLSAIPGVKDWLRNIFRAWFDPGFAPSDGRFSLRPDFYKQTTPPLGLVVVILMTIAPLLGWRGADGGKLLRSLRWPAVGAVVATAIAMLLGVRDLLSLLYVGLAVFALGANLLMIIRTVRGGWLRIGGYLTHVGVALLLVGFVASSAYATPEQRLVIPQGQTQTAYGHQFTFKGYEVRKNAQGVEKGYLLVEVERDGKSWLAEPLLYFNDRMGAEMKTPAIKNYLLEDLYITPQQYIPPDDPNIQVLSVGEQGTIGPYTVTFVNFDLAEAHTTPEETRATVGAILQVTYQGITTTLTPQMTLIAEQEPQMKPAELPGGHSIILSNFDPRSRQVMLAVEGLNLPVDPAKADIFISVKPGIGLVWLGMFVVVLGGALAIIRRVGEGRQVRRRAQVPAPGGAGRPLPGRAAR